MSFPTGVEIHNGKIRITFSYRGTRCRETLKGWVVSNQNIKKAGNLRARIVSEIQLGTFDYKTAFPESKAAKKFQSVQYITHFGDLASTWFDNHKIELSPNTARSYGSAIKMLNRLVGSDTAISTITNNDILTWRKELLFGETNYETHRRSNKEGRAVRTVDHYLAVLKQILEFAFNNKFIKERPHDGVKRLQRTKTKPDPLLKHEFQQLINAAPEKQKNLWQLAVYTGIRPGELCALAWEDINLSKGEMYISRNLTQEGIFGPPKTKAGQRTIKLLEPALNALKAQIKLTGHFPKVPITIQHREFGRSETQNLHFVFMPRPLRGKQIAHYSVSSINSIWNVAVRRANIRRRRPYQTRHTFACWLLSAGANPAFIATQMGHENAQMVYTVYSAWIHALDGDQIAFLNKRIDEYNTAPIVPLKVKSV
ncbi:site-specific integrase [Lelliottia amnigena]|uniref:site-specific integrase n=1 Tax=Lelliottia amnigena TaxID=61646 RepID=UPI0019596862|nr:site-specific integrase [Lelliottia amnigena]MBM7357291.1 integrase [Lelliottia amnigena]WSO19524.1 site-specific integrase [Lelliottia amnigena]